MVLLDTIGLSNFAHMGRLDLLRLALCEAATTAHVVAELAEGVASGLVPHSDLSWLHVLEMTRSEEEAFARTRVVLGDGEASRVVVALERGVERFSDDSDSRRYATRLGIPVSGTLGVLSLLVSGGHLSVDQADECLRSMIAHGYRSPIQSMAELRADDGGSAVSPQASTG